MTLHAGDVSGTTSAHPALSASRILVVADDAADGSYRIGVPLSVPRIFNSAVPVASVSLKLTAWSQLGSDGVLSGYVGGPGTVLVPRSITAIERGGGLDTNAVIRNGSYAASTLATNLGVLRLAEPVTITPAGGTLVSRGPLRVDAVGAEIDGAVQVFPQQNSDPGLDVLPGASLTTTGSVSGFGGGVAVSGRLTTPQLALHGSFVGVGPDGDLEAGTLTFDTHSTGLAIDGGGRVATAGTAIDLNGGDLNSDSGCNARIVAPLIESRRSITTARLYPDTVNCREYVVEGPVTLDGELFLDSFDPQLGDRHVILRSTGRVTGTFATIRFVNDGPDHWDVTYTRHEVAATLVPGNV